jgi:SAM-dependent methyltransferase
VLDIGCGAGRNLTWIAATMPDAELCLGVDLAATAIADARAFAAKAGVSPQFEVCDFEAVHGEFDIIIASGLYSWIAERTALLRVVDRLLSPDGIAYVNFHEEDRPWREELLRHRDPSRIPELAGLDPGLIFHDAMAPISDPVAIDEFVEALPPGLAYLCDARMPPEETFHEAVLIRSGRGAEGDPADIWWVTEESFPAAVQLPEPPEEALDFLSAPRAIVRVPCACPVAWKPARRLVAAGEREVMNFYGAMVELEPEDAELFVSLDGTRPASGETVEFLAQAGLLAR